jgi:predicted DNA-binding transcriptional regulator AlpA
MSSTPKQYIQVEGPALLTQQQVCELAQFDPRTILRMCADDQFPKPVINQPRRRRWAKAAVEAFIRRGQKNY